MAKSLISLTDLSAEFKSALNPHPRGFLLKCMCSFATVFIVLILSLFYFSKPTTVNGIFRYPISGEVVYLHASTSGKLIWRLQSRTVDSNQLVAVIAADHPAQKLKFSYAFNKQYDSIFATKRGLLTSSKQIRLDEQVAKGAMLFKITDSIFDSSSGELLIPLSETRKNVSGLQVVCSLFDYTAMQQINISGKVQEPLTAQSAPGYAIYRCRIDSLSYTNVLAEQPEKVVNNAIVTIGRRSLFRHLFSNFF